MNDHDLSPFYRIALQYLLLFVISITTALPVVYGQSRLRKAIDAGIDDGLSSRISALESYELISRSDAQAVIDALASIPLESMKSDYSSPAYTLVSLFDTISDPSLPAMPVFLEQGVPLFIRIFDQKRTTDDEEFGSPLLFKLLQLLAASGTLEGTNKVIEAAKGSFHSDSYQWSYVLLQYVDSHPHRDRLFRFLSKNIPQGAIGIKLLGVANQVSLADDEAFHPFDSQDGMRRIRSLLEDQNPEDTAIAVSAAVALAFVYQKERDELIDLALVHRNVDVILEGAWASGRLGQEKGLKVLQKYCSDYRYAAAACEYLEEVSRADLIPKETLEGAFKAQAEFAKWLEHPNELGEVVDEVVVVDQRKLRWPMAKEETDFYVMRFLLRDKWGLEPDKQDCGVVGSMTWCFFFLQMDQRPPEDVYAIHAAWEMQAAELIKENETPAPNALEDALKQWTGKPLEEPKYLGSFQVSRRLKIGKRQPVLIEATLDGERGWAIVDGDKSAWYPASEQPVETPGATVMSIHLGLELLGLDPPADRKAHLKPVVEIDKSQWVKRFEMYLDELKGADPKRQRELFEEVINNHYESYLEYAAEIRSTEQAKVLLETYPKLLEIAQQADEKQRKKILEYYYFNALGANFIDYLDALAGSQRLEEAKEVFAYLSPYLKKDMNPALYGAAAYKAELMDVAEGSFEQFLKEQTSRGGDLFGEMTVIESLARLRFSQGKKDAAQELLTGCIQGLVAKMKESEEQAMQPRLRELLDKYQKLFLELYPDEGARLTELGVEEIVP